MFDITEICYKDCTELNHRGRTRFITSRTIDIEWKSTYAQITKRERFTLISVKDITDITQTHSVKAWTLFTLANILASISRFTDALSTDAHSTALHYTNDSTEQERYNNTHSVCEIEYID